MKSCMTVVPQFPNLKNGADHGSPNIFKPFHDSEHRHAKQHPQMQGEAVDVPGGAGTPRGAEAARGLPPCRKVAAWPALSSQHFCSN